MFRKHLRIRRLVLGLAFAAVAIPVAPAGAASLSTFVDGGPAPQSIAAVSSAPASYLRYHDALAALAQPSVAVSERSYGVRGPDPSLVPQVVSATSEGFDWTDAGIGASTGFGVALLVGIGLAMSRRTQRAGLTPA